MTKSLQEPESSIVETEVECYLCNMVVPVDKTMQVPLTTGGNVRVHPSCLEFYMSQTTVGGGCGGCTGGKGCC